MSQEVVLAIELLPRHGTSEVGTEEPSVRAEAILMDCMFMSLEVLLESKCFRAENALVTQIVFAVVVSSAGVRASYV